MKEEKEDRLTREFRAAMSRHKAGEVEQAAERYEKILRERPKHADALHLLGVARQQGGQIEQAIALIGRAIKLDASKAVYHNNYAVALRAAGRLREAQAALRQALAINDRYPDAHSNMGMVLHELDRPDEAVAHFQQTLRLAPRHGDALVNLANLLREQGRSTEAIELYERALRVQPRPDAYNNLGAAYFSEKRAPEAIRAYELALTLDPQHAEAYLNLGVAYAQQDRHDEARRCFAAAGRLRPDKPLWAWRDLSLCPAVFPTAQAVEEYRSELAARLDAAEPRAWRVDLDTLTRDGFCPSFYLSHHGRNDRPLKEKFAALFEPHIPQRRPPLRSGKPRIGFLVTSGHEGGFLRGTRGIIERLDPARFEPVVLCSENTAGRCRQQIRREGVSVVPFPDQFRKAVERIAAAECAVLYHWQADTDALNYLLPFAGLSPVQCTSWGTHGTSGVAAMDYYLSSELVETSDADAHYTETLYRLSTLPTFQPRVAPPAAADRTEFGLPEQGNLYMCPQRLAKFHPDFDELLAAILRADPAGRLVVLAGRNERPREQLLQRWRGSLGKLAERVAFVPDQRPTDFARLLSLVDVVLDPPHYSAGLTGYDIFSLNLPLVTWPGRFNVQRYAAALYRKMGLDDLIARSAEQYVELAVQWGTEPDLRRSIRAQITERSDALFEDREVVVQFEEFLEHALDQVRRRG